METVLVWYFLTSSVVTIGPFTTIEQCNAFAKWTYQYKYVSECWQAPLTQRPTYSIETRPKRSPEVR